MPRGSGVDGGVGHRWRQLRMRLHQAHTTRVPAPAAFASLGKGARLWGPTRVLRTDRIWIEEDVEVLEHSFFALVQPEPEVEPAVRIGAGTRIGRFATFGVANRIDIGSNVTIGDFAVLVDTYHPYEVRERLGVVVPGQPVRIEDDVVLGSHVVVLGGVTIGAGARVEHRVVVSNDVEPGEVVRGHPVWRG